MVVKADWCAGNGTTLTGSATASSAANDPTGANDTASANTTVADSGACDDGNACTSGDACSNGSCVGSPVGPPTEVQNQRFPAATTASWDALTGPGPAARYDLARGVIGEWPAGSGLSETCLQQQIADHQATIAETPAAGSGYWYLVRGHTACGIGTYGAASNGSPRNVSVCP